MYNSFKYNEAKYNSESEVTALFQTTSSIEVTYEALNYYYFQYRKKGEPDWINTERVYTVGEITDKEFFDYVVEDLDQETTYEYRLVYVKTTGEASGVYYGNIVEFTSLLNIDGLVEFDTNSSLHYQGIPIIAHETSLYTEGYYSTEGRKAVSGLSELEVKCDFDKLGAKNAIGYAEFVAILGLEMTVSSEVAGYTEYIALSGLELVGQKRARSPPAELELTSDIDISGRGIVEGESEFTATSNIEVLGIKVVEGLVEVGVPYSLFFGDTTTGQVTISAPSESDLDLNVDHDWSISAWYTPKEPFNAYWHSIGQWVMPSHGVIGRALGNYAYCLQIDYRHDWNVDDPYDQEVEPSVSSVRITFGLRNPNDGPFSRMYTINDLNEWWDKLFHVVGTYEASTKTMTLYVNGVFRSSRTVPDLSDIRSISTLRLGHLGTYGGNPYPQNAVISDARVYHKTLSSNEISGLYSGYVIKDKLVGRWLLNEGEGSVAHDTSLNSSDGTLGANTHWFVDIDRMSWEPQANIETVGTKDVIGLVEFNLESSIASQGIQVASHECSLYATSNLDVTGVKASERFSEFELNSNIEVLGVANSEGYSEYESVLDLEIIGKKSSQSLAEYELKADIVYEGIKSSYSVAELELESDIGVIGTAEVINEVELVAEISVLIEGVEGVTSITELELNSTLTTQGYQIASHTSNFYTTGSIIYEGIKSVEDFADINIASEILSEHKSNKLGYAEIYSESQLDVNGKKNGQDTIDLELSTDIILEGIKNALGYIEFDVVSSIDISGSGVFEQEVEFETTGSIEISYTKQAVGFAEAGTSSTIGVKGSQLSEYSVSIYDTVSIEIVGIKASTNYIDIEAETEVVTEGNKSVNGKFTLESIININLIGIKNISVELELVGIGSIVIEGSLVITPPWLVATQIESNIQVTGGVN